MQPIIKQPFTNVQHELLKTFSHQLSENDLMELRKVLALFFAQRLTAQADKVWKEKYWTDKDMDIMLNTKMRKSR